MSLLKRAASEPVARGEQKDSGLRWDGDRGWNLITGGRDDPVEDYKELVQEGFRTNSVVHSCTRTIVNAVSDAELKAMRPVDGDESKLEPVDSDHIANKIIKHPNRRDAKVKFIDRTLTHYLLGGNTFWLKQRNGRGQVDGLIPVRPDRVQSALTDKHNIPRGFRLRDMDDPVSIQDMVHIPDLNPLNDVFGMPRLMAAGLETRTDNSASHYVAEVLGNHGAPGMVVGVETEGGRAHSRQLRRAEERWQERFGPGKGRGRVAFLPGAHTVREVGFNLRELEFPDLRNVTREGICAVFGVDPLIVSIGTAAEGSTLSGNEHIEARRKLWMHTIIPLLRRWTSVMNTFLAPEFGDIRFKFDLGEIEALKENRNDAINRAARMSEAGVYSPDEIRQESGHEPEPSGDTVVRTTQVVEVPADASDQAPSGPPSQQSPDEGTEGGT